MRVRFVTEVGALVVALSLLAWTSPTLAGAWAGWPGIVASAATGNSMIVLDQEQPESDQEQPVSDQEQPASPAPPVSAVQSVLDSPEGSQQFVGAVGLLRRINSEVRDKLEVEYTYREAANVLDARKHTELFLIASTNWNNCVFPAAVTGDFAAQCQCYNALKRDLTGPIHAVVEGVEARTNEYETLGTTQLDRIVSPVDGDVPSRDSGVMAEIKALYLDPSLTSEELETVYSLAIGARSEREAAWAERNKNLRGQADAVRAVETGTVAAANDAMTALRCADLY